MSRLDFYLKRNDTSPSIRMKLLPKSDVDLTGAVVVFNMRDAAGTVKVNRGAAFVVTATGDPEVRYDWQAADTDTAGTFYGEFEVTYSGGGVETFPNTDVITITIDEDIA